MTLAESLQDILKKLPEYVTLVAVSKTRTVQEILEMHRAGQLHFGENRVQELIEKYEVLPKEILWHQIGHLQKNKVKYIAPFIHLIHSVDNKGLMRTIEKEALKNNRKISVLLQIKIAEEDTKYGLSFNETLSILEKYESGEYPNIIIKGLMGMATFTDNKEQLMKEFSSLNDFYIKYKEAYQLNTLSMGMSDDYAVAIENGGTMVRIGSKLFGKKDYT